MNNNSPSFYYSDYLSDKSETYRKLEQLSRDVRNSWSNDCDETDSMKEIIEMINGMLVMTSLEDYFLNDKVDLEYFMGEFSKEVLTNILLQPIIFGENGDQIGLDLLYHYIKLFMKFHKKKEYSNLFENIRKIFSKPNSNLCTVYINHFSRQVIAARLGRFALRRICDRFLLFLLYLIYLFSHNMDDLYLFTLLSIQAAKVQRKSRTTKAFRINLCFPYTFYKTFGQFKQKNVRYSEE